MKQKGIITVKKNPPLLMRIKLKLFWTRLSTTARYGSQWYYSVSEYLYRGQFYYIKK